MKRLIVLLVVFVQGIMIAGGGSIYSKYGLGDLRFYNSARRLALGGLGTSLEDQNALNAFNPAGWNKLAYTRLEVGVNFIQGGVNSDAGSSGFSNADFSGFMIGFPVYEDYGISFAMGLVPFSSTNYEVESAVTDPVKNYNLVSSGSGSLSKAFFGATYKLPLDIMFGASLEYYTGSYIASSKLEFGSDATFSDAEFKRNTSYSGLGFTLGAISPDLSNELDISNLSDLKIGVSYNFISDLRADTSYNIVSNLGETEVSKSLVNVQIPERF
ncbi:MAG: hypothetical protein K9G44_05190, partial [Melioribacteraceae bacterium]|nr:hypothetical protein [Melioribacteraceae bacterium]